MKKIHFGMLGIALVGALSIGVNSAFTNQALNIGETGGAPARPDYFSFNKGDGGAPVKPDYTRGDTGGAPADNRGDGGAPANFNKGDCGGISKQDSHADHF
ncbi:Phr family secreted Rap phosphatase inhibitor [Bacillus sp. GX]|uniref:Phr family secreted Rap phosphatase inhibitor n=1 Tax=Bacillus TaxID=1386 RepID=UPI0012FCEC87|nr:MULTISPECIES: Phr family secreted Rap phosphatase inhibitor [Bacillus]MDC6155033.1 Phr family secreted Rap phosphatase inhibitor [Bacillus albus]MDD8004510.1 Phr family secreted Rap phosphatase inhibitor [Bacillus albus]WPU75997.1 Phr family secreted Rap phosphatase inhibitor [Bacillus sp. RA(2023)]